MFKFVASLFLVGVLGMSAFAGNCNIQQVQAVVAQPVVTYVQPVRQQFVEVHAQPVVQFVSNGHHHNNVQQVQVQRVVVGHNNVQQVRVQKVVVNQPRVQRSRSVTVVRSR